jgi:hypothetical protein
LPSLSLHSYSDKGGWLQGLLEGRGMLLFQGLQNTEALSEKGGGVRDFKKKGGYSGASQLLGKRYT